VAAVGGMNGVTLEGDRRLLKSFLSQRRLTNPSRLKKKK
jgi:hypothetical protein